MINSNTISRRVRFSLPSHENDIISSPLSIVSMNHRTNNASQQQRYVVTPQQQHRSTSTKNEKGKVHGTTTYVNGTLMYNAAVKSSTEKNDKPLTNVLAKVELKSCIKDAVPNFTKQLNNASPNDEYKCIEFDMNGADNHLQSHQQNKIQHRQLKLKPSTSTIKSYPIIFSPSTYVKSLRRRNDSNLSTSSTTKFNSSNEHIPDLLTLPDILESHDNDCCHCTNENEPPLAIKYQHQQEQLLPCDDYDYDADDIDSTDVDDLFPNFENMKIVADQESPRRNYQKLSNHPGSSNVFGSNEENYSNFMVLVDQWRQQKQTNRKYQLSNFLRRKSTLRTIPKLPPMKRNTLR